MRHTLSTRRSLIGQTIYHAMLGISVVALGVAIAFPTLEYVDLYRGATPDSAPVRRAAPAPTPTTTDTPKTGDTDATKPGPGEKKDGEAPAPATNP